MRILHVIGGLERAGSETWLMQVLRHIDRDKYKFDFLVHTAEPGYYEDEARSLGARVIRCQTPSNPFLYTKDFLRVLKEDGPYDCVHSHVQHFSGLVMLLAAIEKIPIRITHSHTGQLERGVSLPRWAYLQIMEGLIRAFSTSGIAVSSEAGNALFPRNWKSSGRWFLRHGGINIESFRRGNDRRATREELGIDPESFVVGHVGRFVEAKNHHFFVRVAKQLSIVREDVSFLLVGDGPMRQEIEHIVKEEGLTDRFIFAGARSDVPKMLGAMDVFFFPSIYEGLPNALLEAQASGLSCVISEDISHESDAVPRLIRRLSLSLPISTWVDEIAQSHNTARICNDSMSEHDIFNSIQRLCSLYENEYATECVTV